MSRRTPIRQLASGRRTASSQRGRGVPANPSVARLWQSRLGSSRGRCFGRTVARPGSVPEPEQEGRQRPEIREVRSSVISDQRDVAGSRRHPGERLPDRAATAEEAVLTEDRAARQALQTVLPHRQDQGGRRERFRVGPRCDLLGTGIFAKLLGPGVKIIVVKVGIA